MYRIARMVAFIIVVVATTGGCAITEEMRRIEAQKKDKERREKGMSTDLSGQQIFIRSCNTCHAGGKAGMGPDLSKLSEHFPTDDKLKKFLRTGVGAMPPQPKDVLNDAELDNLVQYLREMKVEIPQEKKPEDKDKAKPKHERKKKGKKKKSSR